MAEVNVSNYYLYTVATKRDKDNSCSNIIPSPTKQMKAAEGKNEKWNKRHLKIHHAKKKIREGQKKRN